MGTLYYLVPEDNSEVFALNKWGGQKVWRTAPLQPFNAAAFTTHFIASGAEPGYADWLARTIAAWAKGRRLQLVSEHWWEEATPPVTGSTQPEDWLEPGRYREGAAW